MFSGSKFPDPSSNGGERRTTATGQLTTDEKVESLLHRSREYSRRYQQRKREKNKELQAQVEATRTEVQKLRLENDALSGQSYALSALVTYTNSMIESLTAAASAKARSIGGQAVEQLNRFRIWAKYQLITSYPTFSDLLAGSFYTPSDDQLLRYLHSLKPEEESSRHSAFLDHLMLLIEEGKKSPEAQKYAELRINYIISIWRRGNMLMLKNIPQAYEDIVCSYHLKSLKDRAAAGQYVRPELLQTGPSELARSVGLTPEQVNELEEHWAEFAQEIEKARLTLGRHTSKLADGLDASLQTGVYDPASSADAAKCFLIAMDTAHEFLRDEGRAFIKLYVSAIQVLTPMQAALLLTSCAPLVAHLPDICCMLSSGNSRNQPAIATEGQGFSIADITLLNKFIE